MSYKIYQWPENEPSSTFYAADFEDGTKLLIATIKHEGRYLAGDQYGHSASGDTPGMAAFSLAENYFQLDNE